jgi:hypothetical protein
VGHGGILLDIWPNHKGILVQVSAGVRRSGGSYNFWLQRPILALESRHSGRSCLGAVLFRPLAGLQPKRLPEPPEKPCKTVLTNVFVCTIV